MSLDLFKNTYENNVCTGCLSVNRNLFLLNDEQKKILEIVLDPLVKLNDIPRLCWECITILNKLKRFQTKVRIATKCLANYLLSVASSGSLSHLQISETECISHSPSQLVAEPGPEPVVTQTARLPLPYPRQVKRERESESERGADQEPLPDEKIHCIYDDVKSAADRDTFSGSVPPHGGYSDSDDEPLAFKLNIKQEQNDQTNNIQFKRKKKRKKKDGQGPSEARRGGGGAEGAAKVEVEGEGERVVQNKKAARKLQQLGVREGQVQLVCLSWEQVEEERRRALASDTFTRLEHKCYECVLGFNHRAKLHNHNKKHLPTAGAAQCHVCHVRCRDARALHAHVRRHRLRWRCTSCGATWSRAAVAADHCARAHGDAAPRHHCALCTHVAESLGKLRVHMKTHGARQPCPLCDKTFRDRASLRTHLFIHQGEKEFACPRCDKRFLFKKAMQLHLLTHLASAYLYCHQCDLTFKNRMSYYGHMKYNLKHIDPNKLKHVCAECGKRFAKAARLEEHRSAIHLKVTPFACAVAGCRFAASSRPVLRAHTRSAHRAAAAPRRNHVCHLCGKTYTTKKSLEGHLRAHAGLRPLRCARCPAAFAYDAALYNHTRLVHRATTGATSGTAAENTRSSSGRPPLPPPPSCAGAEGS